MDRLRTNNGHIYIRYNFSDKDLNINTIWTNNGYIHIHYNFSDKDLNINTNRMNIRYGSDIGRI
jgi:uncharacterized beta-barrel protein YwiB (DUF1934 family)